MYNFLKSYFFFFFKYILAHFGHEEKKRKKLNKLISKPSGILNTRQQSGLAQLIKSNLVKVKTSTNLNNGVAPRIVFAVEFSLVIRYALLSVRGTRDDSVIFVISESIVCADHRPHAPNLVFSVAFVFFQCVFGY